MFVSPAAHTHVLTTHDRIELRRNSETKKMCAHWSEYLMHIFNDAREPHYSSCHITKRALSLAVLANLFLLHIRTRCVAPLTITESNKCNSNVERASRAKYVSQPMHNYYCFSLHFLCRFCCCCLVALYTPLRHPFFVVFGFHQRNMFISFCGVRWNCSIDFACSFFSQHKISNFRFSRVISF